VGFFPDAWRPFLSALISIAFIPLVFATLFAFITVIERKGLGRIQNRYGPNRVGIPLTKIRLCGFGQFIPDGIKSLTKEDIVPRAADKVVHFLSPVVLLIPVLLAYAVLPMGRNMTAVDLDAGCCFSSPWAGQWSCPCLWPAGRVTTNTRCWAPCARLRR